MWWPSGRALDFHQEILGSTPNGAMFCPSLSIKPNSTGYTQEVMAPLKHDRKIVDWAVKLQIIQSITAPKQICEITVRRPQLDPRAHSILQNNYPDLVHRNPDHMSVPL